MTIIDRAVEANRIYARTYSPQLENGRSPKIAVVTRMDPPFVGPAGNPRPA